MAATRQIELKYPFGGLNEAKSFSKQMGGQEKYSTVYCRNVVGFDPTTGRNRGGARAGTSKACTVRINGATSIQDINHVVGVVEAGSRILEDSTVRLLEDGTTRSLEDASQTNLGQRLVTLVAVAGGTMAVVTATAATVPTGGSGALAATPKAVFSTSFFGDIYFADGSNSKMYDVSANAVINWPLTAGSIPASLATAKTITGATNATPIVITSTAHGYVNGYTAVVSGVLGNTAANGTWVVSAVTTNTFELTSSVGNGAYTSGGTVQRVLSKASLICTWAGRLMVAGLKDDPNNWFGSAVEDATDWDYDPDAVNVQQAVAGSVGATGKCPDIITALIPYNDDVLILGCDHSIYKILGNPAEGGVIVLVSNICGIAAGQAWCASPEGIIYFMGSRGGIYRMDPVAGGVPNRLTAMTIDERLADVHLSDNVVTMEWDDRAIAVRIYITPTDGTATTHYVWDVRNEAWWPLDYTNDDHNPFATHLMDGYDSADRVIYEGGQDGYLRLVDIDAGNDDGSGIESEVWLGPLTNVMIQELDCTLGTNSGPVTWSIHSASDLETALTAPARSSGRFGAGRNFSAWARTHVANGYMRLAGSNAWALEVLNARIEDGSDTQRRTMRS